jgi:hypothetical protein
MRVGVRMELGFLRRSLIAFTLPAHFPVRLLVCLFACLHFVFHSPLPTPLLFYLRRIDAVFVLEFNNQ